MVEVVEQRDEQQLQHHQQHQQQQQQQHDTRAPTVDVNVKKENIIPSEKPETVENNRKIVRPETAEYNSKMVKPETGENNQRSTLVRTEQNQIFSSQPKILLVHAPFVLATRSNRFFP